MRRAAVALLAVCLLFVGCENGGPSGGGATTPGPPSAPGTPVPPDPRELARELGAVTADLDRSIDVWTASGGSATWPPPEALELLALRQQRVYGTLARDPGLLAEVLPLLPPDLRAEARANAMAGATLLSLIGAPSRTAPHLRAQAPLPADVLLGYYREAERGFGVAWEVLAAVNFIESKFGRVVSASSAGAQGPMQFILPTWKAYGLGGDVHDPHDAILGAANYLHASGAPRDYAGALYHYNPARAYVRAVMLYARQIMRDPRNFYAYYNWQVFALTRSGLVQLTGPGA